MDKGMATNHAHHQTKPPNACSALHTPASGSKIDPRKIDRRRLSISSMAACMLLRTSRLIALTALLSCSASGGYCFSIWMGERNCVCHFDGNGTGKSGKVGVSGMNGQPV